MMAIMRYPDGHKETVRDRIIRAASVALRTHGLDGVSIPELMKRAGMTHGGFYTHFKDKVELVSEAIRSAAGDTARGAFGAPSMAEALELYLSKGHLDHPELGCVVAALGTDGARQSARVRKVFSEVAQGLMGLVERKIHPDAPAGELSDAAIVRTAMIVGAVVLGRLVRDPALTERILAAVRTAAL